MRGTYIPCFVHRKSYHRRTRRKKLLGLYVVILLLLNMLLLGLDVFAQKGYMSGFQLSPNISVGNISYLSHPSPGFTMRPNYGVGGGFVFHHGFKYGYYKNISIRSGMLINYKRYNISIHDNIVDFEREVFDIPLEFPFLLSIRTPLSEHSFLRQYMGISVNYVKQMADDYSEQGSVANEYSLINYALSYQSYVLNGVTSSFIAGIAYEIEGYKGHLFNIGFSYHRGIRPEMVGTLNYTVDNQENNFNDSYTHELIYNGSYLAFNVSVYFKEPQGCWMCWFW